MRREKGFTLIELMIVIAIIAIIAAIAIPGLLQSQRASNERNASASLKTLASAEADFRANDREQNRVTDFWTGDVSGLYCIIGVADAAAGLTSYIKLIELSVAGADGLPIAPPLGAAIGTLTTQSAKAGFWYAGMTADLSEVPVSPYRADTVGVGAFAGTLTHNTAKFGFVAYPDSLSAGKVAFILNEGNTIFRFNCTADPSAAAIPPGLPTIAQLNDWPTDADLAASFSKLD